MQNKISIFKTTIIYFMAVSYMLVGTTHFLYPSFFLKIMPPSFPIHLELVYLSGFFECALGFLLFFSNTRKIASWGLIALLIAVFPANIYLAQSEEAQQALEISSIMAVVRLPFQFLFIGIAFWFTKD